MKHIRLFAATLLIGGLATFQTAAAQEIDPGATSTIMEVQEALTIRGYPVLLSGELDPATRSALRQFQVANEIRPPTGTLDPQTLRALRVDEPENLAH